MGKINQVYAEINLNLSLRNWVKIYFSEAFKVV